MAESAGRRLKVLPLTRERFAPYGDVIEADAAHQQAMNSARFDRFQDLASVDVGPDGRPAISIARCRAATVFPYAVDMLERHPLGSQAFVPLSGFVFLVAVAAAGDAPEPAQIEAFITNGRQGVNYNCGTWHMPMVAMEEGQEFLIVDRAGEETNCDKHFLDERVMIEL